MIYNNSRNNIPHKKTGYIFDFDDTLFITKTKIKITNSKGDLYLSSAEFAKYKHESADIFDFKQFDDIRYLYEDIVPIQYTLDALNEIPQNIRSEDCRIITIRKYHIRTQYAILFQLLVNKVQFNGNNIILNRNPNYTMSVGEYKRDIIRSLYSPTIYDKLVIYEDNDEVLNYLETHLIEYKLELHRKEEWQTVKQLAG